MKIKERSDFKQAKMSMTQMRRSSSKWAKFGLLAGVAGIIGTWYAGWKAGVAQTGDALLNSFAEEDDSTMKKSEDVVDTTATEGES